MHKDHAPPCAPFNWVSMAFLKYFDSQAEITTMDGREDVGDGDREGTDSRGTQGAMMSGLDRTVIRGRKVGQEPEFLIYNSG